jgi:AraC family transcriptional activator of mtrCDE
MDVLTDWVRITGTSGVLLARNRYVEPWGFRMDARKAVSFHIVLEGSCWLRREGEKPLQLLQGDLVLLPHGSEHALVHTPDGVAEELATLLARGTPKHAAPSSSIVCGAFEFQANGVHPLLRELPAVVHFSASRIRSDPALSSTLALLTAELEHPGPGGEVLIEHLFDVLFLYVVRSWANEARETSTGWLQALKDPALSKALSRMHAEPNAPWTVESLAREAALSRAAFARRFTERMGEAPLAYLTRWRMTLAARLLRESDASLVEVAEKVGYDSEFSFSRAFKRSVGQPPSTFRRLGT